MNALIQAVTFVSILAIPGVIADTNLETNYNRHQYISYMPDNNTDIVNNEDYRLVIDESTTTSSFKKSSRVDDHIDISLSMIENESIEIGEYYDFMSYFESIRQNDISNESFEYFEFLNAALSSKNNLLIKAICLFLANIDFDCIYSNEETFIVAALNIDNLQIQEFALNTLLVWDKTNFKNELKNVTIKNYYMQNDLKKFLGL